MVLKLQSGTPDEFLFVPQSVLSYLKNAGESDVKIFLEISAFLSAKSMEESDIINELAPRYGENKVIGALSFWRGAGVIVQSDEKSSKQSAPKKEKINSEEVPFYSAKDLADAAEREPDFKNLVSFAENRLGKVLNESELARLYSFLDYLKMPSSVVMLSIEDCSSRGKNSLRYITKQLTDFEENGAVTYEKAEALLKERREKSDYEHYVRSLFGLGERKFVPKEKKAVETWKEIWHFGRDMLDKAYEKTVNSAKNPTISYMDKILKSWYESGVSTPEDIDLKDTNSDAPKSYDLTDFFEAAVAKTKKKH